MRIIFERDEINQLLRWRLPQEEPDRAVASEALRLEFVRFGGGGQTLPTDIGERAFARERAVPRREHIQQRIARALVFQAQQTERAASAMACFST